MNLSCNLLTFNLEVYSNLNVFLFFCISARRGAIQNCERTYEESKYIYYIPYQTLRHIPYHNQKKNGKFKVEECFIKYNNYVIEFVKHRDFVNAFFKNLLLLLYSL
jgi:hypothetical protein